MGNGLTDGGSGLLPPADLEQPHGVVEAAQGHLAPVAEHEALALRQLPDDVRRQDLAALGQRRDAGRPDDRRPEQVPAPVRVVLRDGLPGVQPDANLDRGVVLRSPFDPSTLLRVRVSGKNLRCYTSIRSSGAKDSSSFLMPASPRKATTTW